MIIDLPTLGHCFGSIFREMQISRPSVQHVILMCHYFVEVRKKTCRPHMRRNLLGCSEIGQKSKSLLFDVN